MKAANLFFLPGRLIKHNSINVGLHFLFYHDAALFEGKSKYLLAVNREICYETEEKEN